MKVILYLEFQPLKELKRETEQGLVKPFKESITVLVATACDFNKEEILSDNDPTCQKCRHGQISAMSGKN